MFFTECVFKEIRFRRSIDLILARCSCRDFVLLRSWARF